MPRRAPTEEELGARFRIVVDEARKVLGRMTCFSGGHSTGGPRGHTGKKTWVQNTREVLCEGCGIDAELNYLGPRDDIPAIYPLTVPTSLKDLQKEAIVLVLHTGGMMSRGIPAHCPHFCYAADGRSIPHASRGRIPLRYIY